MELEKVYSVRRMFGKEGNRMGVYMVARDVALGEMGEEFEMQVRRRLLVFEIIVI